MSNPKVVAFSPDGKLLAASSEGRIHLWATASRAQIREWPTEDNGGEHLAFSPDGRWLASRGTLHCVKLWDYTTGREAARVETPRRQGVTALAFSPDGATLACRGGNAIKLWDVAARQEVGRLIGHYSVYHSALAFSPDGKLLASGSDDTTVIVWDVSGKLARKRATTLCAEELEKHWRNLGSADISVACRSQWELTAAAKQATAFIKERLHPASAVGADAMKAIAQHIADLDSETFAVREAARRELEKLGAAALAALKKVQKEPPSLEARRRVEQLLARIEGEAHQDLRAIEALERIATPQARAILQALAQGATDAPRTREAKAALERLKK